MEPAPLRGFRLASGLAHLQTRERGRFARLP